MTCTTTIIMGTNIVLYSDKNSFNHDIEKYEFTVGTSIPIGLYFLTLYHTKNNGLTFQKWNLFNYFGYS